ncbi:MAG: hypothetical protein CMH53_08825 [Myxococcales bacterium]|nr:hypothetical protein [Myxococcales bacterium]
MRGFTLWMMVWTLFAWSSTAWAQDAVIPAGKEQQIQSLLQDIGVDKELPGGLTFDQTRVQKSEVHYDLRTLDTKRIVATIRLRHRSNAEPTDKLLKHFALRITPSDKSNHPIVLQAISSIEAHEGEDLFRLPKVRVEGSRPKHWRPDWQWALIGLIVALILLVLVVLWRRLSGRPPPEVIFYFKPTHALPAVLQIIIFSYWALYYRELSDYLPAIALQVLFCYVAEATLSFATGHRWRASFGPIPITLSTNLFVLFTYGQGYLTLLALMLALLSKRWIRRQGRHVLNPSAFGTGVVGLLTLFFPSMGYGDSAYQFSLAPNMTELVLLLALVVQFRVPVVLVSASAVAGLFFVGLVTGRISFSPFWAPVTLVIVLLATDPATSPKTPLGRILYGFSVGVLMRACGSTLEHVFDHDFYGKVLGVLLANCFVPWFDMIGARVKRGVYLLDARFNPAHVALWFAFMAWGVGFAGNKAQDLTWCTGCQGAHHDNATRFIHFAEDRKLRCQDNALYCNGFSFAAEWQCWRDQGAEGSRCGSGQPQPRGR